jgi:hypothetical protein
MMADSFVETATSHCLPKMVTHTFLGTARRRDARSRSITGRAASDCILAEGQAYE